MPTNKELKVWLLYKLARREKAYGSYKIFKDDLGKGQPKRFKKRIINVADDLARKGILLKTPHKGGIKYYINRRHLKDIEKFLEENKDLL